MPELKLGTKHECFSCGTKFYDLGKPEPLCPKCGANQKDAAHMETPAVSQASRRRRKAEVPKAIEIEEEAEVAPIEDLDEDVVPEGIEDADLAGEEEEEIDDEE
ncbi:MAG TPA: TIGR02300 family protein [Thermoanaerobaculia bacterium]